jgi:GTP diphosphokinase / guanosine-3',5'-bis(diphosphate) 3'-diphosphatase
MQNIISDTKLKLENRFKELIKLLRDENPNIDVDMVRKAFEFAKLAHAGEIRNSGVEVIWHPLETSIILAEWKMDLATVIAGLLHDTVEHGAATREDITEYFGEEILVLVDGITKVSQIKIGGNDDEYFVENLRKMFLAIAKDLRVVFLRLAERIDNLKSVKFLPDGRRKDFTKNSLEIYAPLAERLGMWEAKTQIEELAFPHAKPQEYVRTKTLYQSIYKNAERKVVEMKAVIERSLKVAGIDARILGRKKTLYSLLNKLKRPDIDWDINKVHDIVALRIIVSEVKDCYLSLETIYKLYKPVPFIKMTDFIALPKPNGYRSIHTKVFGPSNYIAEVQIRTEEMHEEAEKGPAAHWQMNTLKSSGKLDSKGVDEGKWSVADEKLSWVKQLAEWQKEVKNSDEFLKAVKFDALSRRIFVFTPKGDVYDLPENATPVDFAYAVHTDMGQYLKLAKVDGKIVPLNYKLRNGQVVEILKNKEKRKPNHDWLDFVVTTLARREIKKKLKLVAN